MGKVPYLYFLATIDISHTAPTYQINRYENMAHLRSNDSNVQAGPARNWARLETSCKNHDDYHREQRNLRCIRLSQRRRQDDT